MQTQQNYINLKNNMKMPMVGFGTYLIQDEDASSLVHQAICLGYRHVDTAEAYGNESGVGAGIKTALEEVGLSREEIFVTTKLWPGNEAWGDSPKTYDSTMNSLQASLAKLQLDYIDLYLIHAPFPRTKRLEQWKALVELQQQGKVRAIGVSNFSDAHYKPIVAPVRLNVEQNDRQTILTFAGIPQNSSLPTLFVAFELMFWVQLARIATREQINPETVHSSLDLPDLDAYEAYLETRIRHDEINRVTFSAVDAQKPFLTANHAMWAILEPAFNKRMEDLTQDASFRDRVRACLLETLASGHYSMTYVASKLAISNRTLQRRLREEGTTFQEILDELREELARHYLSATDYTSAEISFLLGYEEPNSFFRAFRAWTGQTPEIVRTNR